MEHKFAEGHLITIADIILYACYILLFDRITVSEGDLQLTVKWMDAVKSSNPTKFGTILEFYRQSNPIVDKRSLTVRHNSTTSTNAKAFSLYKSDPTRYKPKNRLFTKQHDIDESLLKIQSTLNICNSSRNEPNGVPAEQPFDWQTIPYDALPEGGQLPATRLNRKKDQLQSLVQEVIRVAGAGDRIVDFCSGAGHLGILLAYMLPKCTVILLENKEESIKRAKKRVTTLQLNNVSFFQCNLDYFRGKFDVGTSLHACGVATDIVLWHCIQQRAHFVSCPCCYGGIHRMPHIDYPRSVRFQRAGITSADYMYIAHCADQAHDISRGPCNVRKSEQGQYCMDVIDTDRKMYAEECGYAVRLTRLTPENCTLKNRLLIGVVNLDV